MTNLIVDALHVIVQMNVKRQLGSHALKTRQTTRIPAAVEVVDELSHLGNHLERGAERDVIEHALCCCCCCWFGEQRGKMGEEGGRGGWGGSFSIDSRRFFFVVLSFSVR